MTSVTKAHRRAWRATAAALFAAGFALVVAACDSPESKAQSYMEDAKRLFEAGDHTRAELQLKNVLRLDDKRVEAWAMMAKIAVQAQNWAEAVQYLRRVVTLSPDDPQPRIDLASIYLGGGAYNEALQQMDELKSRGFETAAYHALRGGILLKMSDPEGAEREANAALALEPDHVDSLLVLAAQRMSLGRDDDAAQILNRVIELQPKQLAAYGLLIKVLLRQDRPEDAIAASKRGIAAMPDSQPLHLQLAALQTRQNDIDGAEATLRHLASLSEDAREVTLQLLRFLHRFRGVEVAIADAEALVQSRGVVAWGNALAELNEHAKRWDVARDIYVRVTEADAEGAEGAKAYVRLALLALRNGDQDEARKQVSAVLAKNPNHEEALLLRASIALASREPEPAIADIRAVLRRNSESVRAYLMLARAHLVASSWELAADAYEKAIEASPSDVEIYAEYARHLLRRRSTGRATRVIDDGLQRAPESPELLRLSFQVAAAKGDWIAAEKAVQQLSNLDSNEAALNQMRGVVLRGQQKIDQSLESFQKAHEASPRALQPIFSVVRTYLERGEPDNALNFLQKLVAADPENIAAWVTLGDLQTNRQEWDAAADAFGKLLEVRPEAAMGYVGLARVLERQGKSDDAVATLKEGIGKVENPNELRLTLATYHERRGNIDGAIATYEEILAASPDAIVPANNLASLLADYREDKESLNRAEALAQKLENSRIPQFLDTLGWVRHRLGKSEAALPLLEQAQRQMPDLPAINYHLGMVQLALDLKDLARQSLEKAAAGDAEGPFVEKAKVALRELNAGTTSTTKQ